MEDETIKRAALVLLKNDDGDFLCVWNRAYKTWALPGGKVEPGETPAQAMLRELSEETGVNCTDPAGEQEWFYCDKSSTGSGRVVYVFRLTETDNNFEEPLRRDESWEVEPGTPVRWMQMAELLASSKFGLFYRRMLAEGDENVGDFDEKSCKYEYENELAERKLAAIDRVGDQLERVADLLEGIRSRVT